MTICKVNLKLLCDLHCRNCYVFSVLKYGFQSWILHKSLQERITAFEYWCY